MTTAISPPAQREITLFILAGRKVYSDFLQSADVFEKFKVFVELPPAKVSGRLKEGETLSSVIPRVKAAVESGGFRVVAIFHPYLAEGAWKDPTVKSVSDGHQWAVLDELLANLNFVSE